VRIFGNPLGSGHGKSAKLQPMVREFFRVAAHGLGFLVMIVLLCYLLGSGSLIGLLLFYEVVQHIYDSSSKKISGQA
jgi:Na+-transporting NADH:ubiquinone oxidoreductase subunit NqrD